MPLLLLFPVFSVAPNSFTVALLFPLFTIHVVFLESQICVCPLGFSTTLLSYTCTSIHLASHSAWFLSILLASHLRYSICLDVFFVNNLVTSGVVDVQGPRPSPVSEWCVSRLAPGVAPPVQSGLRRA